MPSNLIRRLISGDDERRTRFHDAMGTRPAWSTILFHGSRAFAGAVVRSLWGRFPSGPWLPYTALEAIEDFLLPSAKVLEFGSGNSTVWMARRCSQLVSIEHDPVWFERVHAALQGVDGANVAYELRSPERYADTSKFPDGFFDLVLVDGLRREECVSNSLTKIGSDGGLYLDNSDRRVDRAAYRALSIWAETQRAEVEHFIDFAPGSFYVTRGSFVRRKST
jgi:hypothetical protein